MEEERRPKRQMVQLESPGLQMTGSGSGALSSSQHAIKDLRWLSKTNWPSSAWQTDSGSLVDSAHRKSADIEVDRDHRKTWWVNYQRKHIRPYHGNQATASFDQHPARSPRLIILPRWRRYQFRGRHETEGRFTTRESTRQSRRARYRLQPVAYNS